MELAKAYDPKLVEDKWYVQWLAKDYFRATPGSPGSGEQRPYCITIPPPNITGSLHIGHALNNSVLDAMTRWRRMRGFNALCLPGTDHAGIGTQNVVERELAKEGLTRHDLGREKFVERCWEWRKQYGDRIYLQFHKLGCSYDWSRARFTMDESYVDAIHEEFIRWWERGLIYRGARVVNWCPRCRTAISDIEVNSEQRAGKLYHFRYPFVGAKLDDGRWTMDDGVVIATTRPETMLGDTAVAVNQADPRYADKIGKMLRLPLTNREIPLIADEYVKMEFGTGAVKVTPAHDLDDFECGLRHNLPQIVVIGEDGAMTREAGARYAGMDRFEARETILKDLEEEGLLEKVEDHSLMIPHCDRCGTVLEPLLSEQWFVNMKPLAEPAIRVAVEDKVHFVPERYKRIYLDWMENIRDWCISRQLWWGHRIPVWWTEDRKCVAARSLEEAAEKLGVTADELSQDPDVLDTWFSSALWPHATLGWPRDTDDLRFWYPTNLLSTAQEILYLWVARMIMTGMDFVHRAPDDGRLTADDSNADGDRPSPVVNRQGRSSENDGLLLPDGTRAIIPFYDVYVHATVLDEKGERMSKSKGNGIDPLDMIEKYGADALRFALLQQAGMNQDIRFSEDRVRLAGTICNKLWNASRFVLSNIDESVTGKLPADGLTLVDRWILSRLSATIAAVNLAFAGYNMDDATAAIYRFFWNDFCDWYLEMAKPRLRGDDDDKSVAQNVLANVLETTLRLMHPLIPFITEEIWQALPHEGDTLLFAEYPEAVKYSSSRNEHAERNVALIMDTVRGLRNLRAEMGIDPGARLRAAAVASDRNAAVVISDNSTLIADLARLKPLEMHSSPASGDGKWIGAPVDGSEVFLEIGDAFDVKKELERIDKELAGIEGDFEKSRAKLENPQFTEKAPAEIVEKQRVYSASLEEKKAKLEARRKLFGE